MNWLSSILSRFFSKNWLGETDLSRISAIIFWAIAFAAAAAFFGWAPLLWALAALMCGLLLGFLFGIPRVQQGSLTDVNNQDDVSGDSYRLRVNTNLEEISDWLTKIIVGLGLVQLGALPGQFESIVRFLAQDQHDLGTTGSILVLFSALGFLAGYLLTRVYLAGAFSRADQNAASFARRMDYANAQARVSFPFDPSAPEPVADSRTHELIELSPRGAIIESWLQLTRAAREAIERSGWTPERSSRGLLKQLAEHGILSQDQARVAENLLDLRNIAVHSEERRLSSVEASEYSGLAQRVKKQLDAS